MKSLILSLVAVLGLVASADAHGGHRHANAALRAQQRAAAHAAQFNAALYRQQVRQNFGAVYVPQPFIAQPFVYGQQLNDGCNYGGQQLRQNFSGGCGNFFQ